MNELTEPIIVEILHKDIDCPKCKFNIRIPIVNSEEYGKQMINYDNYTVKIMAKAIEQQSEFIESLLDTIENLKSISLGEKK